MSRLLYLLKPVVAEPNNKLWLAKWCKIHKVYIHSHSMLLLIFTNIFIHIQQPNLHSRNIFIHIYLCISYSRLYLLTFTRCLHSQSTSFIIHQTHYEKSDWSRAFNQFTIACELDMINAISAADIAFIMSSSTSAWLLSPLECSPQKQNG